MGAGAVAASGLITLLRTMPTIVGALRAGAKEFGKGASKTAAAAHRPRPADERRDLGSAALVLLMFFFLTFHPVPGAQTTLLANLAASMLVVIFGFLFVTVASRIVGLIGSSASPVSGMTIATLMATTAIFLVKGWTAPAFGALAITIGGVVCVAASNAGDTSQDLKTGFSDRRDTLEAAARPDDWRHCLHLRHRCHAERDEQGAGGVPATRHVPWDISVPHDGVQVQQQHFQHARIHVIHADKTPDRATSTRAASTPC